MICEWIVLKSGKEGTLFEGGVHIPYSEMKGHYKKGEKILVFVPDSAEAGERVSAKIYNYMQTTDRYKVGDTVPGIVYEMKEEMGAFVAVDDRYHGLIPLNELYKEVQVGRRIEARVTKVTDGKLRLSVRKRAKDQLEEDVEVIVEALRKGGGVLYLSDETPPEIIKRKLNLSKKAFKRAVGRLLSTGRIAINEDSIELI